MARILSPTTLHILRVISEKPEITIKELFEEYKNKLPYKDFYNTLFRLSELELIKKEKALGIYLLTVTKDGQQTLDRSAPKRDGTWKLIIFDIPEKQKYVRTILRAKLASLHFKKWQNSIWISPYALDADIEAELTALSKKYFIRLIKTTEINETGDLEKMFSE